MNLIAYLALAAIVAAFAATELATRHHRRNTPSRDDLRLDLATIGLLALAPPLIFAITNRLCALTMPEERNAWAHLRWWGMGAALLLGDDLTQYLWHRASHTRWLWPLHRARRGFAAYMSIRMAWRNSVLFYALLPGLWISGVLIYLGLRDAYLVYMVVKLSVIMGAHSAVAWDAPLYRMRALPALAWLVEHDLDAGDASGPSRDDGRRWHRARPWQLRQPAVRVGRAVRHREDFPALSGAGGIGG